MKKLIFVLLVCVVSVLKAAEEKKEPAGRIAIILQAGNETNEGMARAIHALVYARSLADGGYNVVLIFDGAGTGWATEFRKPESPLHAQYVKFREKGIDEVICDYCAETLGHKEQLSEAQRKLLNGDYDGHPDIAQWVSEGYQVMIL